MSVLTLLGVLVAIGVGLWLIAKIKMDPAIQTIIRVVGIVIAILFVLYAFGLFPIGDLRVPTIK